MSLCAFVFFFQVGMLNFSALQLKFDDDVHGNSRFRSKMEIGTLYWKAAWLNWVSCRCCSLCFTLICALGVCMCMCFGWGARHVVIMFGIEWVVYECEFCCWYYSNGWDRWRQHQDGWVDVFQIFILIGYKLRLHPVLLKCDAEMAVTSIKPKHIKSTELVWLSSALVIAKCEWETLIQILSSVLSGCHSFAITYALSPLVSVAHIHTFPFWCCLFFSSNARNTTTKFNVIYVIDIRPDTFSFTQSISYLESLLSLFVCHIWMHFYVQNLMLVLVLLFLPAIFFRFDAI